MNPIFITGIGTGVGKTLVAAIVTEALRADYWKPVQAGYAGGTDSEWVRKTIDHPLSQVHPESYRLALPASPHIAARQEGVEIDIHRIVEDFRAISARSGYALPDVQPAVAAGPQRPLVIEGAGGLLVPLNENEFVTDLIRALDATVILVSRNYLGSINHSLLTAAACKAHGLRVAGWIFSDQYGHYEADIVRWTGIPSLASVPHSENPGREFVREQAERIGGDRLLGFLT
jgi:dethiobiotin synthetase